jgi:CO dehydrogenase/acetyl-CoA synthase epsilon subunit
MTVKDASWLAQYLRSKKKVLILAGALCDQVEFEGKGLLDYVVDIAKNMKAPVAATGNTVTGLRARGIDTGKAWAAEVVNFIRYEWQYPLIDGKPEVLVFMGYSPILTANLASAVEDAESVALGSTYVDAATYSLPDVNSFKEWQKELTTLVQALEKS